MLRKLRIAALLYVLLVVALTSWSTRERNTDWNEPLWVVIYPINGEANGKTNDYINALTETRFEAIETSMRKQAGAWGVRQHKPVEIKLAPVVEALPPGTAAIGQPARDRVVEPAPAVLGVAARHV